MAIITSGKTFSNGEQLSADKLNQVISGATFNSSDAVDNSTMTLIGGAMAVNIIAAAQIGIDAVETVKIKDANVTLPKIATQADQTVLANVSGGTASPTAVPIVDDAGILINNDSLGTSDAKGATQGNIKAYVDASSTAGFTPTAMASDTKSVTLPNGLIMKFGTKTGLTSEGNYTVDLSSESADFPNACLNASATAINADGGDAGANDYWMQVKSISSSEIVYVFQATSTPESGASFFWQAIGH
tara:strand:+ start:2801 stop:3535 length:735 start_codon:yes stop_codon:yes gene_type:complete